MTDTTRAVIAGRKTLAAIRDNSNWGDGGLNNRVVEQADTALEDLLAVVDRLTAPPADWPIPRYAMLDIWMALYGSERSEEFEAFADEHGFAETWARLCAEVRGLTAPPSEPCGDCGWTGPRTQYLGAERVVVAHPDGPHDKDWLPALRLHLAASGRRHLPTEPEYEYGVQHFEDGEPQFVGGSMDAPCADKGCRRVRRTPERAAGPWEVCDEQ